VTRQADDAATAPWAYPALLLATLFLNFTFWYAEGPEFPFHGPAIWYVVQVLGAPILLGVLFYLGPALATQASKRSLFELAEASLGSIGALILRVCCAAFLVVWLGEQFNLIVRWLLPLRLGTRTSATVDGITAGVLVLLLFWNGLQSAKVSLFTNILGVALLIAALIRVRTGWPEALHAITRQGWMVETPDVWRGLAQLAFWAGPLLFLASDFGRRCQSRKQVNWMGLCGIVLAAAGTLVLVGFIEGSTYNSDVVFHGRANILTALAEGHSPQYVRVLLAMASVTMFGAAGFQTGALTSCLAIFRSFRFVYWTLLGLAACIIGVLASILFLDVSSVLNPLARCLAAAAAVTTADFLTGRRLAASNSKIDSIGVTAFLIGWGLPYVPDLIIEIDPPWWNPWLLRTYMVSFSVCLFCGIARKLLKRGGAPNAEDAPDQPFAH
jgi:hypothetical protein